MLSHEIYLNSTVCDKLFCDKSMVWFFIPLGWGLVEKQTRNLEADIHHDTAYSG